MIAYGDSDPTSSICPVCGFYCLGKGGHGCIDKPGMIRLSQPSRRNQSATKKSRVIDRLYVAGMIALICSGMLGLLWLTAALQ